MPGNFKAATVSLLSEAGVQDDVLGGNVRSSTTTLRWFAARRVAIGLLAACLVAIAFGSVGIGDEGYLSMDGDTPRYLMDGVFFRDLGVDHPFGSLSQLVEYTRLYYARYPALSIGHHPILLPVLEAPLYWLFGVSAGVGRLVPVASLIAAVIFLYLLVNALYGAVAGCIAGVLFATSPFVVVSTRSVLSEMLTLALVLAAAYFLMRFCATERRSALVAFVVTAVLSVYAKQLAIFVAPGFAITAIVLLGRRAFARDVLLAVCAIVVLTLPMVPLTLYLASANISILSATMSTMAQPPWFTLLRVALGRQLAWPVVGLALVGIVRAVVMRDRRAILFLAWIASVSLVLMLVGRIQTARYSVYWVPAFCAMAASLAARWRRPFVTVAALGSILIATGAQAVAATTITVERADGYEEAAQFVLRSDPGPTVLFSGDIDSGFFTFFVRKHDPERRLVVLRSDKLLTTSFNARPSVEERIHDREEIYQQLHKFGVRYVVIEDRPSSARVLEWLREELRSSKFIERRRIPIGTSDRWLRGTNLAVYEFLDRTPPDPDAVLSMNLPLIRQSVTVKLSDLISRKLLR